MNKFGDFSKKLLREISEEKHEIFEEKREISEENTQEFYIKYKYSDKTKYPEIFSLYKNNNIQGTEYSIALIKNLKTSFKLHELLKDKEYIKIKCYFDKTYNSWIPMDFN